MPSGPSRRRAARRKAAKKEEEKEIWLQVQTSSQPLQEGSGNEHNHDHESVNEEDKVTPKSSIHINGKEKGEDGSPVKQKEIHGEGRENQRKTSCFYLTCSNGSAVPENGEGRENEPEVLFSGVLHGNNVLVRNMGPMNDKGGAHAKGTSDGDEIYSSDIKDESEVSISKQSATLLRRKSWTSWFNCCGILELFTSSQSSSEV
ncbi:hypothetical protein SUGI_0355930 [Cryptomeria japonica]|nr:hypothetical protein SUGI_0355930 [Cryptomeria japonica]